MSHKILDGYAGVLISVALVHASGVRAQPEQTQGAVLRVDLPAALRLADERNLDVAIYLERVAEASAEVAEARTLAIPTLRLGSNHVRHTGNIQETSGQVIDADRVSQFTGLDLGVTIDIADAIFVPSAADENRAAVTAASTANRHQVLVDVTTTYLRLLQARMEAAIVDRALARAVDLATLTANYAEAGEGLLADAEMAAVQPLVWEQRRAISAERSETAGAALAELLHLEPNVRVDPVEAAIPALEIFTGNENVEELVRQALAGRPETEQYDALVAAAEDDLTAQRYGLFIPGIALNYSTGDFGGAPGSSVENSADRDDLMLTLYWQFDNFGLGQRARTSAKAAELRRAGLERDKLRARIVAEVREAHARLRSLKQQLAFTAPAAARAEQAYTLQRERIYDQLGLPLEALQAMQMLVTAELAHLDTVVAYALAQVRLHTALGNPIDTALQ
jgi:outer membrane protein TolC